MKRKRNWAVMWGSGLGDILVIRPFLMALAENTLYQPLLLTTSRSYIPDVVNALSLNVKVKVFSNSFWGALQMFREAPGISRIYIGPHNTAKTKLLAYVIGAGRILHSTSVKSFIADAIADDIVSFGLSENAIPYGSLPIFKDKSNDNEYEFANSIVVHCGAKALWETTIWPIDKWIQLLSRLNKTNHQILFVGTERERKRIEAIASKISGPQPVILTNLSLMQLERIVGNAKLVICHNSGVMHLAIAYKRPTTVITGSSAHYWRAPYQWVENVTGPCDLGCNEYVCPKPELAGICIKGVEVDAVYSACMRLLT